MEFWFLASWPQTCGSLSRILVRVWVNNGPHATYDPSISLIWPAKHVQIITIKPSCFLHQNQFAQAVHPLQIRPALKWPRPARESNSLLTPVCRFACRKYLVLFYFAWKSESLRVLFAFNRWLLLRALSSGLQVLCLLLVNFVVLILDTRFANACMQQLTPAQRLIAPKSLSLLWHWPCWETSAVFLRFHVFL